ncbi:Appr-1-p processing protein [Clostridium novyi A str. 4570]|uniref:Appr-1-p processing protein n=1 Tax=Clostridium novyi A str. 4570 TaxID=1444290 RepID=A0AA88ZLN7_CLONO|nr:macro domain-containing protein [Clostridium novyi]KGM99482.1 Appr-1-p processing protein [Clostridium novyi A str. 4570]
MLKYYNGTVFNSDAEVLVNTVNCFGVMGAGIALEFKLRYPEMFLKYKDMCEKGEYKVGRPRLHKLEKIQILNFPTKNHWRAPSKIEWIEQGLKYFSLNYKKANIKSIAFPKLGTNNGGLRWEKVKVIMEKYLGELEDIDIIICLDDLNKPEGIEKKMVDEINSIPFEQLKTQFKLNKNQSEILRKALPINRFWKISSLKGIGEKTYERLFSHFYNKYNEESNKEKIVQEQLSLF